jgi:hypothetical protein
MPSGEPSGVHSGVHSGVPIDVPIDVPREPDVSPSIAVSTRAPFQAVCPSALRAAHLLTSRVRPQAQYPADIEAVVVVDTGIASAAERIIVSPCQSAGTGFASTSTTGSELGGSAVDAVVPLIIMLATEAAN